MTASTSPSSSTVCARWPAASCSCGYQGWLRRARRMRPWSRSANTAPRRLAPSRWCLRGWCGSDCPCRRLGQAWLGIAGALLRTCVALMVAARPPPSEAGRPLRQWSCAAARGAPIDHTAVQRADIDTSAPDSLPHACTQSPPATNSLALAVDPVLRAAGRPHDPPRTALEHCGTPRSCVHFETDRHRTHSPTSPLCTACALECTMAARAYSWGDERGAHHQER